MEHMKRVTLTLGDHKFIVSVDPHVMQDLDETIEV